MIELETQRLFLRNGADARPTATQLEQDYRRYVIEHEDPSVSFEQYEDEITFAFLNAQRGSIFGDYVIYPKGMTKWVGHCSFTSHLCQPEIVELLDQSQNNHYSSLEFEIGWAISKDYRNQGYATEGAKALLDYCFGELKARRIIALTNRKNKASMRVMEKIGMTILEIPTTDDVIGVAESRVAVSHQGLL